MSRTASPLELLLEFATKSWKSTSSLLFSREKRESTRKLFNKSSTLNNNSYFNGEWGRF